MQRREGAEEEIAQRGESTAVVTEKERETTESARTGYMEMIAETREREYQTNGEMNQKTMKSIHGEQVVANQSWLMWVNHRGISMHVLK